jgi:hypothetical protein
LKVKIRKEKEMSKRAYAIADRIEQGAEALAAFVEGFSDAEWKKVIPGEERSVGILVHHVANMYPVEVDLASQLASGKPIEGVTGDVVDGINADHAKKFAQVSKQEVLNFLRENSKAAADRVRDFSDADLDTAAAVSLNANAPLTAQFFLEDHAVRHSFQHLKSIREAMEA